MCCAGYTSGKHHALDFSKLTFHPKADDILLQLKKAPFLRWFHQLVILCGMGLKGKEKIGRNPARSPHQVGQGRPERGKFADCTLVRFCDIQR